MRRNIRISILIGLVCCFSILFGNQSRRDSELIRGKANRLYLKLAPGKAASPELLVNVPENFVLASSFSGDGEEMHEYVPKGDNIDSWSELVTVMHFKMPQNNLQEYLQKLKDRYESLGSDYHFSAMRIDNGTPCCVYRNTNTAVKINPGKEPEVLGDQDEVEVHFVAQGDHRLCGVIYAVRISKNATLEEKNALVRKVTRVFAECRIQK